MTSSSEQAVAKYLAQAYPQGRVDVTGVIHEVQTIAVGGSPAYRCVLADGTGEIDLLFLGRSTVPGLAVGGRCSVAGIAGTHCGRVVIWNPRYQLKPPDEFRPTAEVRRPPYGHAARARPARRGAPAGVMPAKGMPAEPASAGAQASRVLVVDDDPAITRVLGMSLTARGYVVDLASSGTAALNLLGSGPDLILLDIGLPDVDGLDLIARIRAGSDVPIIVISAQDAARMRTAATVAGADDYLTKPFAIGTLLASMRSVRSTSQCRLAAANPV
jgi:CheY-like chemotaxis protein